MSETVSPSKSHLNRRQLRERKQRKLYSEEWALGDEEFEGGRGFSVAEKLESPRFAQTGMVREMKGSDLTVAFIQQYGFNIPLLFKEKNGLGLRVPSSNFTINDVRMCVGSRRVLDVMDVNTQKNLEMTMKEWQQYYEDKKKTRLLNVISLEFSHTKLDNYVESPTIVRQIDWVDVVWPKQLKESQIEGTNSLDDMMYPKVQKYCLMSVKNCYTDFHVDFGGTSVWYHILKGSKVFWLIPPTEKNLQLYEKWVLSGKQSDVFFGDTVEKCARVYLTAGNTFFIPTGWIHAVYTPTDSLVFGGNFLHSYGIVKQLKIAQVEDTTKVPQKFRYPFFTEMLWYVLAKYVYTLLGRSHLEGDICRVEEISNKPHINLTHYELFGLKEIVMFLYDLPSHKKSVPDLLKDPVILIKDVRTLVERHCKDSPEFAITGRSVLNPDLNNGSCDYNNKNLVNTSSTTASELLDVPKKEILSNDPSINTSPQQSQQNNFVSPTVTHRTGPRGPYKKHNNNKSNASTITTPGSGCSTVVGGSATHNSISIGNAIGERAHHGNSNGPRRRRTRCKICEACQRSDCGECSFCLDMVKFGGPGRAKQTCMMRQCLQPMLPVTAQCVYCHLDGWRQTPVAPQAKQQALLDGPSALMECSVCYEIAHSDCAQKPAHNASGIVNEDLPNSWECPICCKSGKNNDYKPRHFRARQKSSEIRRMSISSDASAIDQKHHIDVNHDFRGNHCDNIREIGNQHRKENIVVNEDDGLSSGSDTEKTSNNKKFIQNREIISPPPPPPSFNSKKPPIKIEIKLENEPTNNFENDEKVLNEHKTITTTKSIGPCGNAILNESKEEVAINVNVIKRRKSDDGSMCSSHHDSVETHDQNKDIPRKKSSLRTQLAHQIVNSSNKILKKPQYAIRPAHVQNTSSNSQGAGLYALDPSCLLAVFSYLPPETLVTCSLVCKVWSTMSVDPSLWKRMNCSQYKLSASLLMAIVRRQPEHLLLDWTSLAKRQLAWIISRLPGLRYLSLQGIPIQAVVGLHTCLCPPLHTLDLSFVRGLNDAAIRDILSPPKDSRPGLSDSKSRLRNLKILRIAGTDISDIALRYITQNLPNLINLDLSSCQRITDAGVAQIGTCITSINTLIELDLSSCKLITELSLDYLSKCDALIRLDLRHVPQVSTQSVIKFAAKSKHNLHVRDVKLVDKRKTN